MTHDIRCGALERARFTFLDVYGLYMILICAVEKWLSRYPHKVEIGGSSPPCARKLKNLNTLRVGGWISSRLITLINLVRFQDTATNIRFLSVRALNKTDYLPTSYSG